MRLSLLAVLVLVGCTDGATDDPTDTGKADADTDADTDTDTDTEPDGDADGDGYADSVDCDDTRADVNPAVTVDVCNGRDDDCDGTADEDPDLTWYADGDEDGFGAAGTTGTVTCDAPGAAFAVNNADCDDGDAAVWPGADEVCDGVDNDCDAGVDDDSAFWIAFYADTDGDGAGSDTLVYGCDAASAGGATNAYDCDDANARDPVFVDADGRRGARGSIGDPVNSIQEGIVSAPSCVVVNDGTYYEDIDFGGRDVVVESLNGSAFTSIVGAGRAPVVTLTSGETGVVRGFTITGGGGVQTSSVSSYWDGTEYVYYYYSYSTGGGVYVDKSYLTLEDVVITGNVLPFSYGYYVGTSAYYYGGSAGGGIYAYGGELTLTDVDIVDNSAADGGAMMLYYVESVRGTRVRVWENSGEYPTIYTNYSAQAWENLILSSESTTFGFGGFYAYYGSLKMRNSTLVGNDYGVYAYGSEVEIDSTAITGNLYGLYDDSGGTLWTLTYNNVALNVNANYLGPSDATGVDGNISENPGFTAYSDDGDADNDTLTLTSRSAMVDAGNPASARNDTDGSVNDIGAFGGPQGAW